jgi:hypothetical protein
MISGSMASPEQLEAAQRKVALAMGACMALTWAPVVGGILSGIAQMKLVRSLLETLEREADDETANTLMWFFSKKTLYVSLATYAPTIGPAIAVVLTYALGQLVIRCATDPHVDLESEHDLEARWEEIEEDIFSGDAVITSYEHFSGLEFPEKMKPRIAQAIDWMSKTYRRAERLPGVARSQHALGGALQRSARAVSRGVRRIRDRVTKKKNGEGES